MAEQKETIAMIKYTLDIKKPAASRIEGHRKNADKLKDAIKTLQKDRQILGQMIEETNYKLERAQAALKEAVRDRDGEEEEADDEEDEDMRDWVE